MARRKTENYIHWTDENIKWLMEHYSTCTKEEAVEKIGKSWDTIVKFCCTKGIYRRAGKVDKVSWNGIQCTVVSHVPACDVIKLMDFIKIMGISQQELEMWSRVYGLRICIKKKEYILTAGDVFKFLEKYQDIWDSTKVQKEFFDECEWFDKKHKKDFETMIQRRWGKEAK